MKSKIVVAVFVVVGAVCLSSIFYSALASIGDDTYTDGMSFEEEIAVKEQTVLMKEDVISQEDKKNYAAEAKNFILFLSGAAAAVLFHEGNHVIVGRAEGVDLDHVDKKGKLIFTSSSKAKSRNIAIAGFAGQALSQEIILGMDVINPFTEGWLVFVNFNNIGYIIADSVTKGDYGDFKFMRDNGINTDIFKGALLAYTAFSLYRLYKNPKFKFLPFINVNEDELMAGVVYQF